MCVPEETPETSAEPETPKKKKKKKDKKAVEEPAEELKEEEEEVAVMEVSLRPNVCGGKIWNPVLTAHIYSSVNREKEEEEEKEGGR